MAQPRFAEDRLTTPQAAVHIGVAPFSLKSDRRTRNLGVPFYKIGRLIYYRQTDLEEWLVSRRVVA